MVNSYLQEISQRLFETFIFICYITFKFYWYQKIILSKFLLGNVKTNSVLDQDGQYWKLI